ncbi:hypothetical protein AVO42_03625 [Thiomicrospira sp. XS5]|uniref:hypothetical protein n=1 Tax=Thiomicrospira sp. XS5 TaxID=1775636 RepID=UPI00074AB603|nr:hypothetical protein [Thiomicrospira sp. XS5]KUJ74500.1 hypothetical protein AVO42_03625 [Thiomicrospira sp. XS5]
MSISSVQAAVSGITSAVNSNAQSATGAGLESTSNVSKDIVDSVVISNKAQQLDRQEQYKMKDAVDLFNDWLDSGREYAGLVFYREDGTEDELLPENKALFDELSTKVGNTHDPEQRTILKNKVDSLLGWGNQEIFNSESDLDKRFGAVNDSYRLQQAYFTEKYGEPHGKLPSEFLATVEWLRENKAVLGSLPRLSSMDGYVAPDVTQSLETQFRPQGTPLSHFENRDFLEKLLAKMT